MTPEPEIPAPCDDCRPFYGRWRRNTNGGLDRCTCERGIWYRRKADQKPVVHVVDPKMRQAGDTK